MNTFTFLTNNPPLAAEFTFNSQPSNPTLSFESPFGVVGPGGPPNVTSPTRVLPNARKDQWSFDRSARAVARNRARHAVRWLEHGKPGSQLFQQPAAARSGSYRSDGGRIRLFRELRLITNDLIADYDAVSVILRKRMSHGLQADAHYTWSRTRDMATHSNGGGTTMDHYDIWRDYGPANWDYPHRFVASYIYDVPFLRNSSNAFLRSVVAGWQIGGITTYQSGDP